MKPFSRTSGVVLGLILSQVMSLAGAAEPTQGKTRYDVYFSGLKAGEVQTRMTREGGQYAAAARVKSSGLIAAITDFRFDAKVLGHVRNGTFRPARYEESSDTGRRKSNKVITYRAGVPVLEKSEKPERHWLPPATQAGTLDPLTAIWQVLADRAGDDLCRLDVSYFDGERRIRLATSQPRRQTDLVTCQGQYIREGGFSKKAMKEGKTFPFELTYEPGDDRQWRVKRMDVQTLRGRAVLIRR